MKNSSRRANTLDRNSRPPASRRVVRREAVARRDLTDCLLQAYEFVAQRAYEKFLRRGGKPGGELEDWLAAERDLLLPITVDIEESADYVRALATAPGFSAREIGVGIEARWLAIIAYRRSPDESQPTQVFALHQLPAEVDPAGVTVVYSEGLLGIRMAKKTRGVENVQPVANELPCAIKVNAEIEVEEKIEVNEEIKVEVE